MWVSKEKGFAIGPTVVFSALFGIFAFITVLILKATPGSNRDLKKRAKVDRIDREANPRSAISGPPGDIAG